MTATAAVRGHLAQIGAGPPVSSVPAPTADATDVTAAALAQNGDTLKEGPVNIVDYIYRVNRSEEINQEVSCA